MQYYHYIIIAFSAIVTGSCSPPIARRPISVSTGASIKQSLRLNEEIQKREEYHIKNLIKKDSLHHYLNSGNGFWYFYTKKDTLESPKPKFGDQVNFTYNIKQLNGAIIYPKEKFYNQNYRIDKEELFFGMREGLKLLKAGESATFIFPSHLAFGFYGDLEKIGHNIPIISEVTVNSIFKN